VILVEIDDRLRKDDLMYVAVNRDADGAIIEYRDRKVGTVHLKLGDNVAQMTDVEILAAHNRILRTIQEG
jgi:hypothetical protein